MAQDSDTTRLGPGGDPYPTSELPEQAWRRPTDEHDDTGTGWPSEPSGDERPPQAPIVIRTGGGVLRGLFFLMATLAAVVAIVLGLTLTGVLPHLQNPFGGRTTDRSQPALLKSIQDMSKYVA